MQEKRTCRGCGELFEDRGPGRSIGGGARHVPRAFCSWSCHQRVKLGTGKDVTCVECGIVFYASGMDVRRGRKFCSQACMGIANRVEKPGSCVVCGGVIRDGGPPSRRKRTCGPACRRARRTEVMAGERNPVYKGDQAAAVRWRSQASDACVVCGARERLQLHHAVYRQHIRVEGGDQWDPRASLTACVRCHCGHHHNPKGRIKMTMLRDENIEFAVDLLGAPAAFEYLTRRYAGSDPRVDALIAL